MERTQQQSCGCEAVSTTGANPSRAATDDILYKPEADLLENSTHLILQLDVPGSSAEAINVTCAEGKLEVRADVQPRGGSSDRKLLRNEYGSGTFTRSFQIGERVDLDSIEASYEDGVLTIRLQKRETKAKQVEVRRVTH